MIAHKLAALPFYLYGGKHFSANVFGVEIVDQIFYVGDQTRVVGQILAVVPVAYGDYPHAKRGQYALQIIACFYIIPAQAG